MNQQDIMRMAKESGIKVFPDASIVCLYDNIERFAELVAQHEREEIAKMFEENDDDDFYTGAQYAQVVRLRNIK